MPLDAHDLDQGGRTGTAAAPAPPLFLGRVAALRTGVQSQLRAARTRGGHAPAPPLYADEVGRRSGRHAADSTVRRTVPVAGATGSGSSGPCMAPRCRCAARWPACAGAWGSAWRSSPNAARAAFPAVMSSFVVASDGAVCRLARPSRSCRRDRCSRAVRCPSAIRVWYVGLAAPSGCLPFGPSCRSFGPRRQLVAPSRGGIAVRFKSISDDSRCLWLRCRSRSRWSLKRIREEVSCASRPVARCGHEHQRPGSCRWLLGSLSAGGFALHHRQRGGTCRPLIGFAVG
jgi:hypothetical protein